jgi:cytochrome c oxidase subunit 1
MYLLEKFDMMPLPTKFLINIFSENISMVLYSTNHKIIGNLYFFIGYIAGLLGLGLSFIIRLELSYPTSYMLFGANDLYNKMITQHALIMIFYMLMPVLIGGFGN